MGSGRSKFKRSGRFVATLLLPAMLFGCTQMPVRQGAPEATRQPLGQMTVATPTADNDLTAQLLQAEFALSANDLKTAEHAYSRAAALSNDPEVAKRAVGLAIAQHDGAAAERNMARWQALGASVADLAGARAQLALDRGDRDAAQRQLKILTASGDTDAWRTFSRIVLGARDSAQAARLLESLATPSRLPDDWHAWLAMSEIGDKLGRRDYAQSIADAALQRFHNADTYAWSAQLQFKAGHLDRARALFAEAVRKAPSDTRLRLGYASLLAQTGDNQAAARVLAKGPQDAKTFAARASFAARAKDIPELARIYAELKRAPQDVRDASNYLLGQLAEMAGKREQALDWYAKVGDDGDHRFEAGLRSALLLHQLGKMEQAHARADALGTEYADDPDDSRRVLQVDAEMYMQELDYTRAAAVYSKALRLAPDNTELLYGRGLAYAESGKIDVAVADLKHLLKLKPDDIDAANALGYTLADNNRDLDEARRLIEQARKAKPNDAAIDDSWGWLQYRLGHLQQAEEALRASWAQHKDADVGAHLAEVLWKRGHHVEARKVLAEAHRLDPHNATLLATQKKLQP